MDLPLAGAPTNMLTVHARYPPEVNIWLTVGNDDLITVGLSWPPWAILWVSEKLLLLMVYIFSLRIFTSVLFTRSLYNFSGSASGSVFSYSKM